MGQSNIALSVAQTNVRNLLDETNPQFWTNAMLTSWLNEACADIQRKVEELRQEASIAVTALTATYPAPVDVLRIYKIDFVPSGAGNPLTYPLTFQGRIGLDAIWGNLQQQPASWPEYYTTWYSPVGANASGPASTVPTLEIQLYPSPAQSGTLNVFYYRLSQAAVSDSDTLDLVPGWEDMVYDYCMYRALQRDADPRWKDFKATYDDRVEELKGMTHPDWSDQPTYISRGLAGQPRWLLGDGY